MKSYQYVKFNRDGSSSIRTGIVRDERVRNGKTKRDRQKGAK